jgi:hypothetical protein
MDKEFAEVAEFLEEHGYQIVLNSIPCGWCKNNGQWHMEPGKKHALESALDDFGRSWLGKFWMIIGRDSCIWRYLDSDEVNAITKAIKFYDGFSDPER